MKQILTIFIFLTHLTIFGQLTEDFSDGNFTTSPTWIGDDSVFTIVDVSGDLMLRSNKLLPSTSFYLSTASTSLTDTQWEFFTQLQFNTSSLNFVDYFLICDQSNLLSATNSGYFVRVGGTTDEISLYKRIAGVNTKIIDGLDGVTNASNNILKIKVTCSATGDWTLARDVNGTGVSYVTEGTVNDISVVSGSFFGLAISQSTATFIQKHFFDDLYIGPIIYDLDPPILLSAVATSVTTADIQFNEPLDQVSTENIGNYDIIPFNGVSAAVLDGVDASIVHLTMSSPFSNGNTYTLTTTGIADVALNASGSQSIDFVYIIPENPAPGDVIINEFMCDQSPVVGLPEVEFIEIYNRSNKYFNLNGWKIGDASADGTIQNYWLYPGEYAILVASANVDSFAVTAQVTSFPSLNNSGDDIVLKDAGGVILDKISYTDAWYQNNAKKDGGWTIELINPNDPCSDQNNWRASNNTNGGTPGAANSVLDLTADTQNPQIILSLALAPNYLEVYFNEGMDSLSLVESTLSTNPSLAVANTYSLSANPNYVTYEFSGPISPSTIYSYTLSGALDCWGNGGDLTGQFVLPELPQPGDVIINEILFDPLTGGSDWIEVYNRSEKAFNLKNWQMANFANDTIANFKTIPNNKLLMPGGYAVIGKDSSFVKMNYPFSVPGTFCHSELPSYNNDSGTVYLIYNNVVLDKVSYDEDWHFRLLDVTDGVSLERLDFTQPSDNKNNWHSAAEAVGYATPGGQNSQFYPAVANGTLSFTNDVISPDNDGFEDVLQINYELTEAGMLGKFQIYDDRGRLIRTLFSNELLGTSGTFVWDGVRDDDTKASIGIYVAVFEAFGVDAGLFYTTRKSFVVAGRL
jgi:hypothetical protein